MSREFINRNKNQSASQQTGMFASRPFANQSTPQHTGMLATRPFAPPNQTPNVQKQSVEENASTDNNEGEEKTQRPRKTNLLEGISITPPKPPSSPHFSIQTKLTLGAPGDKYEQEADQVAKQVVQRLNAPATVQPLQQQIIQHQLTIQRDTATSDAQKLIDQYTSWLNLNEEKLAKDLLSRIPDQSDFVVKVFRTLSRSDRDDVACYLLENTSDEQIKNFAQDPRSRRVLTLMLVELADGRTGGDEEKQRDRVLSLVPSDTPQLADQKKKREAKEQQKENAAKLIDEHTHGLNLREEKLAEALLKRLPGEISLAEKVLDTLSSTDRDDVSLCLLEAATNDQIKNIAKNADGRTLLLRMVQELYKGDMGSDERKQMQRTMDLITQVDQEQRNAGKDKKPVEVEVITFLYGGKVLDALGVALAGGSKGHTLIVIGDLVYSFELGWSCGKTKAEYLADNTYRDGISQVLNLSKDDAEKVQKKLNASCGKGAYIISGDICTDSAAQALEGVLTNLKSGWNPQHFVGYLEDTGKVKSHRFYSKKK